MGENSKELLKQQLKNKRASEGLTEIPSDLFAKKPRYELTADELERLQERRQKNKEAAEKSRRKKKEEFEKLQNENDQLQQDKCELVAMIEKLKVQLKKNTKENNTLRNDIDQLKRWIGKRATDLGLGKHMHRKQAEKKNKVVRFSDSDTVLRGDPSLHSAARAVDLQSILPASHSPPPAVRVITPPLSTGSPRSSPVPETPPQSPGLGSAAPVEVSLHAVPKSSSPQHASQDQFQAVGIRTVVSRPAAPLPLQQTYVEQLPQCEARHREGIIYTSAQSLQPVIQPPVMGLPMTQSVQISEGQQIICLAKETVYVVQTQDGQQILTPAPGIHQIQFANPEMQQIVIGNPELPAAAISPEMPQYIVASPELEQAPLIAHETQPAFPGPEQIIVEAPETQTQVRSEMEVHHEDMDQTSVGAEETIQTAPDNDSAVPGTTTAVQQPSVDSAIQSLLKLGYRIQVPEGVDLSFRPSAEATTTVSGDHAY